MGKVEETEGANGFASRWRLRGSPLLGAGTTWLGAKRCNLHVYISNESNIIYMYRPFFLMSWFQGLLKLFCLGSTWFSKKRLKTKKD